MNFTGRNCQRCGELDVAEGLSKGFDGGETRRGQNFWNFMKHS
jgi:hypothetical protein